MAVARIYKPARTAMQSGTAKTKEWVLEFEPEAAREVEPLMGWTSSGDMRQQVRLRFESAEEAVAYCEKRDIAYQVFEAEPLARRAASRMASTLGASYRQSVCVWSALGKEHSYGTPPSVPSVLWRTL